MDPGNFQNLITEAYANPKGKPIPLPLRKGFNAQGGKDTTVRVNQFRVNQYPTMPMYQYDIKCVCTKAVNAQEKMMHKESTRADLRWLWNSDAVKAFRASISPFWLWDGNRIAWSNKGPPGNEEHYLVRLNIDKMSGREGWKEGDPFLEKVMTFKLTNTIPMNALNDYLSGKVEFDNTIYQCINVMDHIMRQTPTVNHLEVKRSWFPDNSVRRILGATSDVAAHKGTYCSVRLCQAPGADNPQRTGLAVNVDVANAVFYNPMPNFIDNCVAQWCASMNMIPKGQAAWMEALMPVEKRNAKGVPEIGPDGQIIYTPSQAWKDLRKFGGIQVLVDHERRTQRNQMMTIQGFTFYKYGKDLSPYSKGLQTMTYGNYGKEGANAKNVTFNEVKRDGTSTPTSVFDYYRKQNIHIRSWQLPLVEMRKGGLIPMELLKMKPLQRYRFKLNPSQTQDMIKFAVEKPEDRLRAIQGGVELLNWANDPILKQAGIKIDAKPVVTNARILQAPAVQFGLGGRETVKKPGVTGSWQMRDTQLFKMGKSLKNWVVFIFDDSLRPEQWNAFFDTFSREYKSLGYQGVVPKPNIRRGTGMNCEAAIEEYMNLFKQPQNIVGFPPIIMFVCRDKNSHVYERIKHICDCKYSVMTQIVQSYQCFKNNPKYVSNVILKMNAKLGGVTSRAIRDSLSAPVMQGGRRVHREPDYYRKPGARKGSPINPLVMMIGADVSHPGALSTATSFAAITMSMDQDCCKYAACIESNWLPPVAEGKDKEQKQGTEILQQPAFDKMGPLVDQWQRLHQNGPEVRVPGTIYYLRDGVSEGQYQHVLQEEVPRLRNTLIKRHAKFRDTKICVIVASKRHHIRFLPSVTDTCRQPKDGNPVPGLLVERDCTHPFQNDFYLVAHRALIGCARPIHYHVLMDELDHLPHELHELLYAHSYQYMRSTTPVSIHPAIYYAHLASKRGTAHEDFDFKNRVRTGGEAHQTLLRANIAKATADNTNEAAALEGSEPVFKNTEHPDLPGGAFRAGVALVQPKKVKEMGWLWKDAKCPHRDKYRDIYREFAYGMWFI